LNGVAAATQHRQVQVSGDENGQTTTDNGSVSASSRLFRQVDRLFDGSAEDRERALEMLEANEQQVNSVSRLVFCIHKLSLLCRTY